MGLSPFPGLVLVALLLAGATSRAPAAAIDVSLNVQYADPLNVNSGGNWEIVAKSDGFGIAGLKVLLTNTATQLLDSPRGTVNGTDHAGFGEFANTFNPLGFRDLTIGQAPMTAGELGPGQTQGIFYGVGTLTNGTPNSIGPAYNNLQGLLGVPWATGDAFSNPAWSTAAKLASGTFAAGVTPGFFQSEGLLSRGTTFTTLGTSTTFGTISAQIVANTFVRSNLIANGDYNQNGVVDAADYVLWRNTFGQSGAGLPADGNGNGTIDQPDYDFWRARFGNVIPGSGAASGGSVGAVPEPTSGILLLLALIGSLAATRTSLAATRSGARFEARSNRIACDARPLSAAAINFFQTTR